MAFKGVPTNPPGMRRRQTAHLPHQAYEIDLLVGGAWVLVGYSRHPETAKPAVYWTFTTVQGATQTKPADRHKSGMAWLAEEYGATQAGKAAAKPDGSPVGDGLGREDDPLVRDAVERYAVDCAKKWLEDQGWTCHPVGKPFDLRCTKGGQELHAEVKGTRGNGKMVELTRNEVIHNQKPCTWVTACDEQGLFVVSKITVTGLTPSGGKIGYTWPWKITSIVLYDDDGDLIPDTYKYTVPELTVVAL